jgi:serine phosphatase RsbU (regulator of sigma subunit)
LLKSDPNDAWFFNTMKSDAVFNINVDPDTKLKLTKVWFNVLVKEKGRNIGLAGTGLALTPFLKRFITSSEAGVTPVIINTSGDIQAYPDPRLIDYSSINDKGTNHSKVFQLFKKRSDILAMRNAMEAARKNSDRIPVFWANFDGSPKLIAVAFVPNLNWFAVTSVDLKTAQVLDEKIWIPLFLTCTALLILLLISVMLAVNRVLLRPLLRLTDSVRTVAEGNYDVALPPAGGDELGALTKAFASMTQRVKSHTAELEDRLAERTSELMDVNQKIDDSIQYARLIQNAILPGPEMDSVLKQNYFVMWQPRDIVGGDFYLFRSSPQGCLVGIVDCAGHGVPGAFMTMIAHSALNVAIETLGLTDPAALLSDLDERIRAVLQEENQETPIATHLDAGLVYIDFEKQVATYSGAKTTLYYCRDSHVEEMRGSRYAIGGRRANSFVNQQIAVTPDIGFYFSTDGLLDQAGGNRGYGFGNKRFIRFLLDNSHLPFSEQRKVLLAELEKYQGSLPRRDDVTVLGFRIDIPGGIA